MIVFYLKIVYNNNCSELNYSFKSVFDLRADKYQAQTD